MINIYYTERPEKRNIVTGEVYKIKRQETGGDYLFKLGSYRYQYGGADLEETLFKICDQAGIKGSDIVFRRV